VQEEKTKVPMEEMEVGTRSEERPALKKQLSPRSFTEVGMTMERRDEVAWKALAPIEVTDDGMEMKDNVEQFKKAASPIDLMVEVMYTVVMDVQDENAPDAMDVNVEGSVILG